MPNPKLKVEKRKTLGRKIKKLRREGILPANIYGKKVKSQAVQVGLKEFEKIYADAGETSIIDLIVEAGKTRSVLIHNVQIHPVTDQFLHADFRQVVLTEKVKADIPVEIVSESPAVKEKKGILLTILDEIEIEALPADLLDKIEVDVSQLTEVNQEIKVSDLKLAKKVDFLTDSNSIICKIGPLVTKEAEELAKEEEAAAEEAVEKEGKEAAEEKAPEGKPEEEKKEDKKPEEKTTSEDKKK
ncbi:50S ribosomal protein L25 [Candidatus Microgenomates bacterium]|nr:50S ribosomal protein L25 [Candidatus Microgenomates bacterium]